MSPTEPEGEGSPLEASLARWSDLLTPTALVALAWTLGQIALVIWPGVDTLAQRSLHVSFAVSLALLLSGRSFSSPAGRALNHGLAALAFLPGAYVAWQADYITSGRIPGLDPVQPEEYVLGLLLVLLMAEAARRLLGLGLTLFVAAFVAYFFLGPYLPAGLSHSYGGLERFVDSQFLSLQGIFGVPTGVSVSTVFYFILFAAVYDVFGGGRLIIDIALTLTGRRAGGPAKAAVIASGMLGSVSGSAVANVMSTGIFTIPLMKRAGYSSHFAGAVEASASTGAQLVPPVMGAAAFIMADFLQIPYRTIVLAAVLPSVAYYFALLLMVDLRARQRALAPVRLDGPGLIAVLRERGHMLLPLGWLAYRIVEGYPVEGAAIEAGVASIVVGSLRGSTRRRPLPLASAFVAAAQRSVTVALPCALAGIVVGVIAFTGLGTKFTSFTVALAGGDMAILLVFSMLASLVLGAGLPTTSAYIMAAVLLAPSLSILGVEPLVAHFFIFYFSILSMVTPPVALSAYAAAVVANSPASATGWQAFALSLPGFVIPFAAVMHPGLLFLGAPADTLWGLVNVLIGLTGLSVAIVGWLFRPLPTALRVYFAVVGILSILPGAVMSAASFAGVVVPAALLWLRHRRARATGEPAGEDGARALGQSRAAE